MEAKGLFGAPALTVVVGEEVHVSVLMRISVSGAATADDDVERSLAAILCAAHLRD